MGKIIYNPSSHLGSNDKWAILSCDEEISRYYRYLYHKEFPYINYHKLIRPVWGAHISWLRGKYIPNFQYWKSDNNKIIEFEYEHKLFSNNKYFWLKVYCPYLLDLREKLGLSRDPKYGLHLTIGISP